MCPVFEIPQIAFRPFNPIRWKWRDQKPKPTGLTLAPGSIFRIPLVRGRWILETRSAYTPWHRNAGHTSWVRTSLPLVTLTGSSGFKSEMTRSQDWHLEIESGRNFMVRDLRAVKTRERLKLYCERSWSVNQLFWLRWKRSKLHGEGWIRERLADHTRSFLEAGFRPRVHSFVLFIPSWTKRGTLISTTTAPGPSSQVLPGCRVRHPVGPKKVLVRLQGFMCCERELLGAPRSNVWYCIKGRPREQQGLIGCVSSLHTATTISLLPAVLL